LGRDFRDKGQKRVPLPPARINARMRAPPSAILGSSFSWRRSIPVPSEDCPGFTFRRHYGKDHAFFVV
jgi:hypothetical protein